MIHEIENDKFKLIEVHSSLNSDKRMVLSTKHYTYSIQVVNESACMCARVTVTRGILIHISPE